MTRHRFISSIHKFALSTLKFLALAFGTLATIALFCSCRSSDIATRESSVQNRMQETVSQVVKTAPQRKPFTLYLIFIFASIFLLLALYFLIRNQFRL